MEEGEEMRWVGGSERMRWDEGRLGSREVGGWE